MKDLGVLKFVWYWDYSWLVFFSA